MAKQRKRKATGGRYRTPEWNSWYSMIKHCRIKTLRSYKYFGGRGIKVCDRWQNNFPAFLQDMGTKPSPNHGLGRLDSDRDFTPDNCVWLTKKQSRNRAINRFGHVAHVDMVGQHFGKLTVVSYAGTKKEASSTYRAWWHCRCDCGGEKDVRGSYLRSRFGKSISCDDCREHWTKRTKVGEPTSNPRIRIIRNEQTKNQGRGCADHQGSDRDLG